MIEHCPSGDDPLTGVDETDCQGKSQSTQTGSVGLNGNLCQIDCSNRGICDYKNGKCKCFEGIYGENCDKIANLGTKVYVGPQGYD